MSVQAPAIIDQPSVPENQYGMCLSVANISSGTFVYLGNNRNAEKLQVTEMSFHDDMWYLTVVDSNQNQFTVRYPINARISVAA